MSKRLVIILWIAVFALGGLVYFVKSGQKTVPKGKSQRVAGQTLFADFPAKEVAAVTLKGVDGTVHLLKKDGKWTVTERDGYPANPTQVNTLIRTMNDLKVIGAVEGGAQFTPRFGIDETAAKAADHGLSVTFADASGKELATAWLGKSIGDEQSDPVSQLGGRGGSTGRFILNQADTSAVYRTNEQFSTLSPDPKSWLAEEFIQIEKPKTVAVTQPGKSDLAWKVTRDNEDANFALEGATEADKFDPNTTVPLKSLSIPRFEDVVPAADVEKRSLTDQKRVATIKTVEGFTYTLNLTPVKPAGPTPAPAPGEPPAGDNYLVTVDVAANLPAERKKEADEKPEDAKTKDEAFQSRLKDLKEKLAKEQALKGRTFEFRAYALDSLLKGRDGFKKQETPAGSAQQGGPMRGLPPGLMQGLPQGGNQPAEAVTPPIAVPDEEDGK